MALVRFTLDIAIPEPVYQAITPAKKAAFRDIIRELKALSVRINRGLPNEEMTALASWHLCYHDEAVPRLML